MLSRFIDAANPEMGLCPLCGLGIETTEHLFLRCKVARVVWREAPWPLQVDLIPDISFAVFMKQLLFPHSFFGVVKASVQHYILCAALILDSIWFLRNEVVHSEATPHPWVLINNVSRRFHEHVVAMLMLP